jgi:hypothetical protein
LGAASTEAQDAVRLDSITLQEDFIVTLTRRLRNA